jgi:hypothetical protein
MELAQALWLGLIQGLTEFLPVSSSAHLILLPRLLGWPDQGLAFDVAVHVGTLLAVVWHFRAQLVRLTADTLASVWQRQAVGESQLGWAIVLGTLPLIAGALVLADAAETVLRGPLVIAWATIGFGLLLWIAARRGGGQQDEYAIGLKAALVESGVGHWRRAGIGDYSWHVALGYHHDRGAMAWVERDGSGTVFILTLYSGDRVGRGLESPAMARHEWCGGLGELCAGFIGCRYFGLYLYSRLFSLGRPAWHDPVCYLSACAWRYVIGVV